MSICSCNSCVGPCRFCASYATVALELLDLAALRCRNPIGVADDEKCNSTPVADRHGGGIAPRLSAEQEIAGWVRKGPDLAVDKVVRWRCADAQARTADLFGVAVHERSVARLLHRLRFSHVSTRR